MKTELEPIVGTVNISAPHPMMLPLSGMAFQHPQPSSSLFSPNSQAFFMVASFLLLLLFVLKYSLS